jgi:hypothetical protein
VDHAVAVGEVEGVGHVLDDGAGLPHGHQAVAADEGGQRASFQELHDDVRRPDVVYLDDGGVVQAPRRLRLLAEAREVLLVLGRRGVGVLPHHLDGHRAGEQGVHAQVHDAHGAGTQLFHDLVPPEVFRVGRLGLHEAFRGR